MLQYALLAALTASTAVAQSDMSLSHPLQQILSHAHKGPLYTYPTDCKKAITLLLTLKLINPSSNPRHNP